MQTRWTNGKQYVVKNNNHRYSEFLKRKIKTRVRNRNDMFLYYAPTLKNLVR